MIEPDDNMDHFGYVGTGSGEDDLADLNQNEVRDYDEENDYYNSRDEGRNPDGSGESYAERNA